MCPSLFLAAFAAANGVAASRISNTKNLDYSADVPLYLSNLVLVAKDVLLSQIARPSIGADVNFYHILPVLDTNAVFDSLLSLVSS
jgi:hypothetical protein